MIFAHKGLYRNQKNIYILQWVKTSLKVAVGYFSSDTFGPFPLFPNFHHLFEEKNWYFYFKIHSHTWILPENFSYLQRRCFHNLQSVYSSLFLWDWNRLFANLTYDRQLKTYLICRWDVDRARASCVINKFLRGQISNFLSYCGS